MRTYYYHCPPYQSNPPTEEERERLSSRQKFFSALSRLNRFQLRLGKLEKRGEDAKGKPIFVQKRVDIMLGVDMVQLASTSQIQSSTSRGVLPRAKRVRLATRKMWVDLSSRL